METSASSGILNDSRSHEATRLLLQKREPMPRHISALRQSKSVVQSRLCVHSDRRRSWSVRRQPSPKLGIEALEDRVVPATITVTNLSDSGVGTLRAAIEQADLSTAQNTITFAPALTGTITLLSALPDISANADLDGPGATVITVARSAALGTPDFRIFTVPADTEVAISGLTIAGGKVSGTYGGGVWNAGTLVLTGDDFTGNSAGNYGGGGIANSGALSMTDCTLSGNTAWNPNGIEGIGGVGGAIINQFGGTMSIADCTITGNSAWGSGAIYNGGTTTISQSTIDGNSEGALFNAGTLTVSQSYFNGNSSLGNGGAIINAAGSSSRSPSLTVTDCAFSDNSAVHSDGGAILNLSMANIDRCTFTGNSAGLDGGAIESENNNFVISLTIANSTFNSNSANDFGGAICNRFDGNLVVTNSTLASNTSGAAGNVTGAGGGAIANTGGAVTLTYCTISGNFARGGTGGGIANSAEEARLFPVSLLLIDTIVAGNTGTETTPFSDISGAVQVASTHNLIGDGNGVSGISDGTNGNLIGTSSAPLDTMLGPLANNGGPTFTMALLLGSPAIKAGVAVPGVTSDQRGIARPEGWIPDIGAFEVQPPPATVTSVVRQGVHRQPTTIVVKFSHPMNVAFAESLFNYRLDWVGENHESGKQVIVTIPILSAVYNAASFSVTLLPTRRLPLRDTFWLRIWGQPPGGVKDAWGIFLAGAQNGRPGTNAVIRINARSLAPLNHNGRESAVVAHNLKPR
jgi:predicted outer membrane repeat protein